MNQKIAKIRSQNKKLFWLVVILLSLVVFWLLKIFLKPMRSTPPMSKPDFAMPVEVANVKVKIIQDELMTIGSLEANEFVMIRPEIEGRIAKVYFKEGQYVDQGVMLIDLDNQIAKAGLAESQAYLSLSESQNARQNSLYQRQYVSKGERDKAESKLQVDQAVLNRKTKELEKTKIYAPFSGFLGLSKINAGDYVKPGQDIVPLACLDPLKVDFSVSEIYAPRIKVGQKIEITTEALPDKKFHGEIYACDPMIDESGRNLNIKGQLSNKDFLLKPGMFVRLKIQLTEHHQALLVPEEAVVPQDQQHFVYIIKEHKAVKSFVKLGMRFKGEVEILQGVSAQDQVVTAGQIKIKDNMSVKTLPSSTAQPFETKIP